MNNLDLQEVISSKIKCCIKPFNKMCKKTKTVSGNQFFTPKVKRHYNINISKFFLAKNIRTEDKILAKAHAKVLRKREIF